MTTSDTVVLGAGQAGLATAALLQRAGVEVTVLDRGRVGQTWRGHYDRLHLNTDRRLSALPGLPIPGSAGQWPSRDAFVSYLDAYATHHALDVRTGVEARRIDPCSAGWHLVGADRTARRVVVATGSSRVAALPPWATDSPVPLVHSGAYRNPTPYAGKHVLVVGAGNSGAEIAADLAGGDAASVTLSVKDPPARLPRSLGPVPVQLTAFGLTGVPTRVADLALAATLGVLRRGDGGLGLPVPDHLVRDARAGGAPVVDAGLRAAVRAGRVRVVPAVTGAGPDGLLLADGARVRPDAVVAATGWGTGLADLVGHLAGGSLLDGRGRPRVQGGPAALPGLHFVGYGATLTGFMLAAGHEAAAVTAAVTGQGLLAGGLRRVRRLLPLPA